MTNLDVNDGGPRGGGLRLAAWAGAPLLILLIPLVAMLSRAEGVDWSAADFLLMGILLGGGGLAYALATMRVAKPLHRAAIGLGVLAVVLLVWVDAAVGVIGIFGGS